MKKYQLVTLVSVVLLTLINTFTYASYTNCTDTHSASLNN